jgi:hypothetical protein
MQDRGPGLAAYGLSFCSNFPSYPPMTYNSGSTHFPSAPITCARPTQRFIPYVIIIVNLNSFMVNLQWIHTLPFRPDNLRKASLNTCEDRHELCTKWASEGECEHNPGYMVGNLIDPGTCRKACNACKDCPPGDVLCMRKNYHGEEIKTRYFCLLF